MNKILLALLLFITVSCAQVPHRNIKSLNGEWQIARTMGEIPQSYNSTTTVPGVVNMAMPALDSAGSKLENSWYWHKRTFVLADDNAEIVSLKIFKAKYHTKLYINNTYVGENLYSFTPSYFDIKPYLKPAGEQNEIVIAVGSYDLVPDTIANGRDFEKLKYIPGIYDNVEITTTGRPYIVNVQLVPDIKRNLLRVVAEIDSHSGDYQLQYEVRDLRTKAVFSTGKATPKPRNENGVFLNDFEIDMYGAQWWSPENPQLYEIELRTAKDCKTTRFGMRSFTFDPTTRLAMLNDKPYYLRGTNVCIFRFFEDPERASLPWDEQWVTKLHSSFKKMHWNSMRYCIGFPPEKWYEIADSLGILIADEFPLWSSFDQLKIESKHLAAEYKEWMRERWNHPAVVIWDAQNESTYAPTKDAISMVRRLDLSNRPWENGWAVPENGSDPYESHPYIFSWFHPTRMPSEEGYLKDLYGKVRNTHNDFHDKLCDPKRPNNPNIINEYGWIWLNRDGSTTTLTDKVYEALWGNDISNEKRLEIYGKNLGMLTEYWRAHRKVAGVFHFCGLGYSRPNEPRGETSDHWIDIKELIFEPNFYEYVRPAFSPVGLMIDRWEKNYTSAEIVEFPVHIINDLNAPYNGKLNMTLVKNGVVVLEVFQNIDIQPLGKQVKIFKIKMPASGSYELRAEIVVDDELVSSRRDLEVI